MTKIVTGILYESITRKLFKIGEQLHQKNGYPFDPNLLNLSLELISKGKFPSAVNLAPDAMAVGVVEPDKFREMIAAGTMIVHRGVKVDRNRTPQEVIAATDRKQHVDNKAVQSMPRGQGDVVDLYYIKANRFMSDDEIEKWFKEELGLEFDPCAQAADNEANPAFADNYPNGTHWKNAKGEWCFSAWYRWCGERDVDVNRSDYDWSDRWCFGGRKLVL